MYIQSVCTLYNYSNLWQYILCDIRIAVVVIYTLNLCELPTLQGPCDVSFLHYYRICCHSYTHSIVWLLF